MNAGKKTLLLLGATSDIGFATGIKFAEQGFNLILAARQPETLAAKAVELKTNFKIEVELKQFDATQTNDHKAFAQSLTENPDVVLIAFGINGDPQKSETATDEAALVMQTNFTGVVSIINALLEKNKLQSGSTVIVISSIAGDRGKAFNNIYGSSKAALNHYLQGLRIKLKPKDMTVINIKPGYIRTKMLPAEESPDFITSTPAKAATDIYQAYKNRWAIVYTPWYWRYIMFVFRNIPHFIFQRLKK